MKISLPSFAMLLLLMVFAAAEPCAAAPVAHLQVRIVTGAAEMVAGSVVELRIYEAGKSVVRVPLTHGESWAHDSTRLIPVTLSEPIDPRAVLRFGLYYRASSPLSPPWEIVAADVDVARGRAPELLLNATLSGVISKQGELATEERAAGSVTCVTDADCDDHRRCNGVERCAPGSPGADPRGCLKGSPVACPVNQVCTEDHGCRGLDAARPAPAPPEAPRPSAPESNPAQ